MQSKSRKASTSIRGVVASTLVLFSVVSAATPEVYGFAANVTGGKGASASSTYVVTNFEELRTALKNNGQPHAPKLIYINGILDGNYLPSGQLATDAYYAQGTNYNWETYLQSFNETLKAALAASSNSADAAYLALLNSQDAERKKASKVQETQISLIIGNNTSIEALSTAQVARIQNGYIAVKTASNVILRNLEFHAAVDRFPQWDPTDGSTGNWNSKYDTVGVVTSERVLITQCTFSDGAYSDSAEPVIFGKGVMRHDGMIDIVDGSDYVTVSYNKFFDHDKSHLIGNSDTSSRDKGRLHVTFHGNWWINSKQRSPRVRFGQVHVFNNLYQGEDTGTEKLSYYIGMGINSTILSENNVFEVPNAAKGTSDLIVTNQKGYNFKDVGSTFNGTSININASAEKKYNTARDAEIKAAQAAGRAVAEWATHNYTSAAFKPSYTYTLRKTKDVKKNVMENAGQKL